MLHKSGLKNYKSKSKKYRQVLSPAPFYIPWFLFEHQLWGQQEEVHPQPLHFCHLIEVKLVMQGKKRRSFEHPKVEFHTPTIRFQASSSLLKI
jgi:hypothetical protein